MDFGSIREADSAIAEGEWVENLPGLGDGALLVRSPSSSIVKRESGHAMRMAAEADGRVSNEARDRIDLDVTARFVLLGWRNLTENGESVPFSVETARQWLEVGVFYDAVQIAAMRVGARARARVKALQGNSSAPSTKP